MKLAEEVARELLANSGNWDDGDVEIRDIADAITQARQDGAEDMRYRAAYCVEECRALTQGMAGKLGLEIREIPLTLPEIGDDMECCGSGTGCGSADCTGPVSSPNCEESDEAK